MSDPLPCPFCGKDSTVVVTQVASNWFTVKCDVCNSLWADTTLEKAIARWNRRAPLAKWQPLPDATYTVGIYKTIVVRGNTLLINAHVEVVLLDNIRLCYKVSETNS